MLKRLRAQSTDLSDLGRADLIKRFNDPFAFMGPNEIRRLHRRGVRLAATYTALGALLCALHIWTHNDSHTSYTVGGRSGAMIGVAFLALLLYGIYRVFTIKRWMLAEQRDLIATAGTMNHRKK